MNEAKKEATKGKLPGWEKKQKRKKSKITQEKIRTKKKEKIRCKKAPKVKIKEMKMCTMRKKENKEH